MDLDTRTIEVLDLVQTDRFTTTAIIAAGLVPSMKISDWTLDPSAIFGPVG